MCKRLLIRSIFFASLLFCCLQHLNAQTDKRMLFIDSLINAFQKQKNDSIKGSIALNIAAQKMGVAQNTGNWDEAIEWASKGVYYSKKGNYKFGIRRCNWQLGRSWMLKGNYPEAIRYFTEMLNAAINQNAPKAMVTAYNWIGDCYMLLGKYQDALKTFQTGFTTCEKHFAEIFDYKSDRAGLMLKIGDDYAKMKMLPEAISWYKKLLSDNSSDSTGEIHTRLALAQIGMKNYDDALKNLQIAVHRLPRLLDYKSAAAYDTAFKGLLGSYYMQIGEAYCKIGSIQKDLESVQSYKEAINYLNKCLPLLKEGAGGKESLMNAYELLKQSYEATSDYQNALHFTTLYNGLKDSLYSKTTYLKLADLQVKYKTEKAAALFRMEQEKENLKSDALLANQKLEQEQLLTAQKLAQQKQTAERNAAFEKSLAAEKAKQEKIRAEKQQTNNLLLMGLAIVIVTSVFLFFYLRQRNQKIRAVEKAEAIHKMAELEMQSLRSQLNPHFMFNSLNSIQELILLEENDKSHIYLSRFSKLLRMLLENAEKPFIPLQKEIDFLQLYLDIENLRVPDLQYSISTDPALNTEQILIPNLILQPYIENAIWHGLAHKVNDKQLKIRIYSENGTVNYEIEDNGVGRKKSLELKSLFRKNHVSKGMELLTKRFKLLNEEYSTNINIAITDVMKNDDVAGTLVRIKVPVQLPGYLQN